jgi:hypothetical protein
MADHPMTSPITAEERAKGLYPAIATALAQAGAIHDYEGPIKDLQSSIASAIREAEDAALERAGIAARRQALEEAAQICDAEVAYWGDAKTCSPKVVGMVASQIRGLKGRDFSADPLKSTKETGHE